MVGEPIIKLLNSLSGLAVGLLLIASFTGCATTSYDERTASVVGPIPTKTVEVALKENPLAASENIKITMLRVNDKESFHVVQIRNREKLHRHNTHAGKVWIWKGNGTLLLGGKNVAVREGDVLEIPKGIPHAYTNQTDHPTVALVRFTPPFDGKDTEYLE